MKVEKDKIIVDLLFEEYLEEFLERFDIYEKFIGNKIRCEKCNKIVTSKNLGLIKIKNGEIGFVCNDPECIRENS